MNPSTIRLQCDQLNVAVNGRVLVRDLNLDIEPGSFVCILGTNGVGKTLTLHTLAGIRDPSANNVTLCGDLLTALPRRVIARRLGLLLQIQEDAFPLTVMESVLMGRYPRLSIWQWPGPEDEAAAHKALASFDLQGLEHRLLTHLSGGERERLALATLMTQDPDIWLLDEPMNHLDPHHQLEVLRTLQQVSQQGRIVVASLHNPAMAMRYADHALLLYGDGEWEFGTTDNLLQADRLERLYQTPFASFSDGTHEVLLPV
jgi:iron complex transport system ATP-binding protein